MSTSKKQARQQQDEPERPLGAISPGPAVNVPAFENRVAAGAKPADATLGKVGPSLHEQRVGRRPRSLAPMSRTRAAGPGTIASCPLRCPVSGPRHRAAGDPRTGSWTWPLHEQRGPRPRLRADTQPGLFAVRASGWRAGCAYHGVPCLPVRTDGQGSKSRPFFAGGWAGCRKLPARPPAGVSGRGERHGRYERQ